MAKVRGKPFDTVAMADLVSIETAYETLRKGKKTKSPSFIELLDSGDSSRSKAHAAALRAYHATKITPAQEAQKVKYEAKLETDREALDEFMSMPAAEAQALEEFAGMSVVDFFAAYQAKLDKDGEAIAALRVAIADIVQAPLKAGVSAYNTELGISSALPVTHPVIAGAVDRYYFKQENLDIAIGWRTADDWTMFAKPHAIADDSMYLPVFDTAWTPNKLLGTSQTSGRLFAHGYVRGPTKGANKGVKGVDCLLLIADGKIPHAEVGAGGVGTDDARLYESISGNLEQWLTDNGLDAHPARPENLTVTSDSELEVEKAE